jgi:TruD family tRNA pseudouridine synthase
MATAARTTETTRNQETTTSCFRTTEASSSSTSSSPCDQDAASSTILQRHFSTIGIGNVFVQPPPHPLLHTYLRPQQQLPTTENQQQQELDAHKYPLPFISWEIVGTIKSIPEDFCVREILLQGKFIPGLTDAARASLRIAGFDEKEPQNSVPQTTPPLASTNVNRHHHHQDQDESKEKLEIVSLSKDIDPRTTTLEQNENETGDRDQSPLSVDNSQTPSQVIEECLLHIFFSNGHGNHKNDAHSQKAKALESLQILYQSALQRIRDVDAPGDRNLVCNTTISGTYDVVWIPPIPTTSSSSIEPSNERQVRGALHRALKVEYPLLKSESAERNGGNNIDDSGAEHGKKDPWFLISIDETFYDLIPFLHNPVEDLTLLYLYRNRGILDAKQQQQQQLNHVTKPTTANQDKKFKPQKKKQQHHHWDETGVRVVLRLRPDLPKDDRRAVHHLISQKCRLLETNTISNYPLIHPVMKKLDTAFSSLDELSVSATETTTLPITTTVVVVQWSKTAMKGTKKRKRNNVQQQGKQPYQEGTSAEQSNPHHHREDPFPHVLCVMKKYQKEHMTAIQYLAAALRCSASDIGVAGIKDMQAVTYQYCTLRQTRPSRVLQANRYLRDKGIDIGTNNTIFQVDWVLNKGDLEGNHFDIVLRSVSRVEVLISSRDASSSTTSSVTCAKEILVPCTKDHILEMVKRVQTFGFVNFYGEQRVGAPGSSTVVGVRAFDIGRAMLQQNFALAIDLLLTGRLVAGRADGQEENEVAQKVRATWKATGGDAAATLKCLPHGETLPRERAILKGLKRFGEDKPLQALQCLQYSMRIFWINAYQSYVWNMAATARIERYGMKVVPGDLYLERCSNNSTGSSSDRQVPMTMEVIKIVDESNLSSVTLAQVLLPLPGYNMQYPTHEIAVVYHRLLELDGIRFDKSAPLEATAKGSYRHLIAMPNDMSVTFLDDTDETSHDNRSTTRTTAKTVKLSFELPKGSYATMLLRELMVTTATRLTTQSPL